MLKELSETYIAIGAGGLSIVVVVWVLVFLVRKLYPLIESLKMDYAVYSEIIKNNTEAVKEVSRSNENVATALKLLDNSNLQIVALLDKHDNRSETIENSVIRMDEKLNSMTK